MKFSFVKIPAILVTAFLLGCSTEFDTRGAERLQFSYTTPPNIKSAYEVILGNLEAKKYQNIHGPVESILQKSYMIQKDENGNLLDPHFSGTVKIHYLPSGEMADFASYDSTGMLNTLALVIHKANRREIYVHLFESNRDYVYYLANDNRVIEEETNPFYRKSPVDGSWNSADGHFSWEENSKHQIIAATGVTPSVQYRHIYEYDENDSLVRIIAYDAAGKKRGSFERTFKNHLLQSEKFRFDERIFYPDLLNYTKNYEYDSKGRIVQIVTKHSKAWSPQNDTVRYVYKDSADFSTKNTYRHGELESSIVYDSLGNATFAETFDSFVYEGADGTAESYDAERIVREIHYYGEELENSVSSKEKPSLASLTADEFFRSSPDSAMYCEPNQKQVFCHYLRRVPGTIFLNFLERVTYKNASEVYLELNSGSAQKPILLSNGKCATILKNSNELLFENSLVAFKREPYSQFFGDTITFSLKNFPCEL